MKERVCGRGSWDHPQPTEATEPSFHVQQGDSHVGWIAGPTEVSGSCAIDSSGVRICIDSQVFAVNTCMAHDLALSAVSLMLIFFSLNALIY